MDATVTDFLNEINQIAPKKDTSEKSEDLQWQECYDELTGYSYYWNTKTDEVTWTPPKLFKSAENNSKKAVPTKPSHPIEKRKPDLFVPPSFPQYSTKNLNQDAKNKIYSIQETVHKAELRKNLNLNKQQKLIKATRRTNTDSDDDKIELITEYGGDSDSESDEAKVQQHKKFDKVKDNESQSDEDDDIDLLAKIQQRAKELKNLGGEVPPEIKNIIQKTPVKEVPDKPKVVSGFSLVAGYNSDSDNEPEQDIQEPRLKPIFPLAPPPTLIPETSHSTLFPIPQPIDVKDFLNPIPQSSEITKVIENPSSDFDSKAFQRKRRIGISLVNTSKRSKDEIDRQDNEFQGFGFKSDTEKNSESTDDKKDSSSIYPGFQKGGVMFVKSNTLSPTKEEKCIANEDRLKTDDIYNVLRQKLLFLGEGRAPVLPVQVMLIQAETLFNAMKDDGLKSSYLDNWLQETSSELIKLEKEAAPEGWLLEWDRSNNRYFYQNRATGESQWEYPQPDVRSCDDAMDISTTPPPMDLIDPSLEIKPASPVAFGPQLPVDPPLPPSPPKIRSPTPPPPPMISLEPKLAYADVPLPPQLSSKKNLDSGEPLPPGVDVREVGSCIQPQEPELKPTDSLSSVLDSFYSEIAGTITTNSNSPDSNSKLSEVQTEVAEETRLQAQTTGDIVIKRKKKKVKLAHGLTMKKKGVSQLVEKWKNVQKNLSD